MRKHAVLFVQLFVAAIFLSTYNFVFAQTESSPQIRQKTFEKVWKTVDEKFYDANFGGVDWKAIHERYTPQVAQVKTDAELHDLLNRMLGEIKTSHLQIFTPETLAKLKSPPVSTGMPFL